MRKLFCAGAASLVLGATGLYCLPGPSHPVHVVPVPEAEEQELARFEARPLPRGPEVQDPLVEPIVVERADDARVDDDLVTFTPGTTSLGGRVRGGGFDLRASVAQLEPVARPDAEVVPQRRMPYADEEPSALLDLDILPEPEPPCAWYSGLLCGMQQLRNLLTAAPAAEEEAEAKDLPPSGPEPPLSEPEIERPAFDPAQDYHRMYPSCPYTGRCPAPNYPVRGEPR